MRRVLLWTAYLTCVAGGVAAVAAMWWHGHKIMAAITGIGLLAPGLLLRPAWRRRERRT